MEESNEIYDKVVAMLEEGVKPLEQLYEKKGVVFNKEDVGMIAETFRNLYNDMIIYYEELV